MTKLSKILLIINIVSMGVIIYLATKKPQTSLVEPIEITKEIEVRDSIYIVNDSIETLIKYVEKKYDEKVSDIISNDIDADLLFFSEYVEHFNNSRTVENN